MTRAIRFRLAELIDLITVIGYILAYNVTQRRFGPFRVR